MSIRELPIGSRWAYCKSKVTPSLEEVEILQRGPKGSMRTRVRYCTGPFDGAAEWVLTSQIRVPWDEGEAWLHDLERENACEYVSRDMDRTTECDAVRTVINAYPHNQLRAKPIWVDDAVARIPNFEHEAEGLCASLGFSRDDFFSEPEAFINRLGEYRGPWPITLRLAHRICEAFPDAVLLKIAKEEENYQREAVEGCISRFSGGRISPEICAKWYRERQPVFDLVRFWCRAEATATFDEVAALRELNTRYREAIEGVVKDLEDRRRYGTAAKLRELIGMPPRPTQRELEAQRKRMNRIAVQETRRLRDEEEDIG